MPPLLANAAAGSKLSETTATANIFLILALQLLPRAELALMPVNSM